MLEKRRLGLAPNHKLAFGLLTFGLCFVCGGATCAHRRTISEFAPPVVFQQTPTLDQLIEHANRSLAIQRIESNTLTISSPDITMAKLNGNLQWERPHNFSLQAYPGSRVFGTVLAAGSNSQEFWLQMQSPEPTLVFASHDAFENQTGPRYILPVSPLWLREALGIVEFDPACEHQGPQVRSDGKLKVVSFIPSPRGAYRREVVFEPSTGAVEEMILKDHTERIVATAQLSQHEYYSAIQSSLPHKVIIQLQPDRGNEISFTVDVGFYLINQASNAQSTAFIRPDGSGMKQIDLVQENAMMGHSPTVQPVYRASQAAPTSLESYRR